jgi:hypothetical protein
MRRKGSGTGEFLLGRCFGQLDLLVPSVLWQLFVEDQTKYCGQSLGAIVTELAQSNHPQKECPIMVETAEMMN